MNEIVLDVISSLENFKDPKRIAFAKTSYPTKMRVIGVTVPNEKIILKELKVQTKKLNPREKIELVKKLSETGIFECQHIAFEYLGKDKKALRALTERDINELDKNLDNWVSVDCFSAYILGFAWREGIIDTSKIKSYLNSKDFWRRRIPIVATVSLNQKARGGTGDPKRTLEICELVIDDHHDMINKAMSWALRELSKVEKKPVEDFIEKHEQRLNARVLREVKNKLSTGTKQ